MTLSDGSRVLVTGGSGFIGTNVLDSLGASGIEVTNLDLIQPRNLAQRTVWHDCDLLNARDVHALVDGSQPTHVLHLGARTDLRGSRIDDYAANTTGTENLMSALSALSDPPRLIVASSRMVCPIGYQPMSDEDCQAPNAYGQSKVEAERIVRRFGYTGVWTIVRPTSIWGPWFDLPYRDFFVSVARGRYRHPSGVRIRKSFGFVGNTVAQLLALLTAERDVVDQRTFYLADYEPIEVLDFAQRIALAAGGPAVKPVPIVALRSIARVGDSLAALGWSRVSLTTFRLSNLLTEMLYDLTPLKQVLVTLPTGVDAGIDETVRWMCSVGVLDRAAAAG